MLARYDATAPVGVGIASTDQLEPFHISASVTGAELSTWSPTAAHHVVETHDTETSEYELCVGADDAKADAPLGTMTAAVSAARMGANAQNLRGLTI
jgi:hypothetical protein